MIHCQLIALGRPTRISAIAMVDSIFIIIIYAVIEILFYLFQIRALHAINATDAQKHTKNMRYRSRVDVLLRSARLIKGTRGFVGEDAFPEARDFKEWIKGWTRSDDFASIHRENVREFLSSFFFDAPSRALAGEDCEVLSPRPFLFDLTIASPPRRSWTCWWI